MLFEFQYHLPNNCYAERHLVPRMGARVAAAAASFTDAASNTELVLQPDEAEVLRALEEQSRSWLTASQRGNGVALADEQAADGAVGPGAVRAVRGDGPTSKPTQRVSDASSTAVVAIPQQMRACDPPFTPEVPIRVLLDALWVVRYRPQLLKRNEIRRQRVALLAAKRKRMGSATRNPQSPSSSNTQQHQPSQLALDRELTGGRQSPSTVNLSESFASSMEGAGGTSSAWGLSQGATSVTPTTQLLNLIIPSDEEIPTTFPIATVSSYYDSIGATNVNLRALSPSPNGEALYFGNDLTCRCVLDVVMLCPNVKTVSLRDHHVPNETMCHLITSLLSAPHPHPSLEALDLRGNVIEVATAKLLRRLLRSNPRIVRVELDGASRLLPTTEAQLKAEVASNARKMRAVHTMRNEWTQTTWLPNDLPGDIVNEIHAALKRRSVITSSAR